MKMRKTIAIIAFAIVLAVPMSAQNVTVGEPNPAEIGKDQAQQLLKEISASKFEDAAFWFSSMPLDMGIVTVKRFEGAPLGKKPIEDEAALGIQEADKYVLGVRVDFFHRGASYFTVHPMSPIPIEGISKTISVWAVGRNYNHVLKVLLQDYYGQTLELSMGKLNFLGWKKLTVAVPPNIVQSDYHYGYKNGVKLIGFKVECDPMEAYGSYYVYFDDMRVVTDLFAEAKRDIDDMSDSW